MSESALANHSKMSPVSRKWVALLSVAAVVVGVVPLYSAELNVMAHKSMYQFFPFVFAFIGWVGWTRWQEATGTVGPRASSSYWLEFLFLLMSLGCLVVHAGLFGPWLGGAAGTFALAAGVAALRRMRKVRLWDLWALSLVAMRLPLELDGRLANFLQRASSVLSDHLLDAIGILHYRAGNVIQLVDRELFVDEACSGVISVMSVIACGAILSVWKERRLLHTFALVALAVMWAMIMNVVRICSIAIALVWFDLDWTSGWQHEMLGLGIFLVTFAAVVSTDVLLTLLFSPIPDQAGVGHEIVGTGWLMRLYNGVTKFQVFRESMTEEQAATPVKTSPLPRVRLSLVSLLFLAAGLFHGLSIYINYANATADHSGIVAQAVAIEREEIAPSLVPWRIVKDDFEERDSISELAPYSRSFEVENAESSLRAVVSLDFPFYRKWHDVSGCYVNSGWEMPQRKIRRKPPADGPPNCQYIAADLKEPGGVHGHMIFANLNEDGRLVAPPQSFGNLGYLANVFVGKLQHSRQLSLNPKKVFQIQVFSTQGRPHTEDEKAEVEKLFFQAFRFTRQYLEQQSGGAT